MQQSVENWIKKVYQDYKDVVYNLALYYVQNAANTKEITQQVL